jgi:uncharacterized protein YdcH (DUF465 family)
MFEWKGWFQAPPFFSFMMISAAPELRVPRLPSPARHGRINPRGRDFQMERPNQDELKAHLMATDEEFRRLAMAHSEYARKIEAIEQLPHPTNEQQMEEVKLKKLKLHAKDMMTEILNRHAGQMQ